MPSLISVIIPVYQAEKTISRCLDSLINQTYRHWEAICINDGSTDLSGNILDQYALHEPRLRIIHQANSGVSASRNRALDLAQGDYITFLDSDDWVDPHILQELLTAIQSQSSDMSICGLTVHHEQSNQTFTLSPFGTPSSSVIQSHIINCHILRKISGYNPTKLFHSAIINRFHIRYDTSMQHCEDGLFLFYYLSHIKTITSIDKPLYHYSWDQETSLCFQANQGQLALSQYQKSLSVPLQCSNIPPSYINHKDWLGGLFARQCDSWLSYHTVIQKNFSEIHRINNQLLYQAFPKLFFRARQPYAVISLVKTIIKLIIFLWKR